MGAQELGAFVSMTWAERLERAARDGGFAEDDACAAMSWTSCAVGEHLTPDLRDAPGLVEWTICHQRIRLPGQEFTHAVTGGHILDAIALYHWIETEMAAELGREL